MSKSSSSSSSSSLAVTSSSSSSSTQHTSSHQASLQANSISHGAGSLVYTPMTPSSLSSLPPSTTTPTTSHYTPSSSSSSSLYPSSPYHSNSLYHNSNSLYNSTSTSLTLPTYLSTHSSAIDSRGLNPLQFSGSSSYGMNSAASLHHLYGSATGTGSGLTPAGPHAMAVGGLEVDTKPTLSQLNMAAAGEWFGVHNTIKRTVNLYKDSHNGF